MVGPMVERGWTWRVVKMQHRHRPLSPWGRRPVWWEVVRRLPCRSMVGLRRRLLQLPRLREEPGPTWTNRRPRSSRPGRCFGRRAAAVDGVEWGPVLDRDLEVPVPDLGSDHSTLPI